VKNLTFSFLFLFSFCFLVLALVFRPYEVQLVPEACISNYIFSADRANLERCCNVNCLTNCLVTNVTNVLQKQEAQLLLGDRATRKHAKDS